MSEIASDNSQIEPLDDELISPKESRRMSGGMSTSTQWRLIRAGRYPKPVRISPGRTAFRKKQIRDWIASLPEAGAAVDDHRRGRRPQIDRTVN